MSDHAIIFISLQLGTNFKYPLLYPRPVSVLSPSVMNIEWRTYLRSAHRNHLRQCCPTFLAPQAAQDKIMKPRAAPVNSKITTNISWTLIYCICVIVIFRNQRLSIMHVHDTFDKFYPSSVTNCHKSRTPPLKYFIFSTYKFALAKYNLNFKLMYNHLFIHWIFEFFLYY